MNTATLTTHQDKSGAYRMTDRDTYKKLKQVRFFSHVARIQNSRWQRWSRKLPKNRVKWVFDGFKGIPKMTLWKAVPWAEPEQCPICLYVLSDEFANACKRWSAPEHVVPMHLSMQALNDMLLALNAWADRVYPKAR